MAVKFIIEDLFAKRDTCSYLCDFDSHGWPMFMGVGLSKCFDSEEEAMASIEQILSKVPNCALSIKKLFFLD
jgi:hypothetical protein